ncbi:hypothetical protein BH18ACT6_BH18ACT6_10990 [soil metagenome]
MRGMYPAEQRIPEGLRRMQVLLPVEMVVELIGIARTQSYLSRSKVIALAVRKFIDGGDLDHLDPPRAGPTSRGRAGRLIS